MNYNRLIAYAFIAATMTGFTSCSDDDEPMPKDPDFPTLSSGAYVLNQGSYSKKIEGALNVIDYTTATIADDVFTKANNRSLGSTPQCGIAYGGKIYLGMYGSKTIEIIDRYTYKSVQQIRLDESTQGQSPRNMVAKGGKVYISMTEGFVARLDTAARAIDAAIAVGKNPETMVIMNDHLYVPNSDWYATGYGKTASVVSLNPFAVENTIDTPANPNIFLTNGTDLFLICWGNYSDEVGALYRITATGSEKIADATMGAIKGNTIYAVNAPYGADVEYWKYDITTKTRTVIDFPEVEYPSGIGVDPINDNIIISSLPIDGGYASYSLPGTVCQYRTDGTFVKKYNAGVGPAAIFFNAE